MNVPIHTANQPVRRLKWPVGGQITQQRHQLGSQRLDHDPEPNLAGNEVQGPGSGKASTARLAVLVDAVVPLAGPVGVRIGRAREVGVIRIVTRGPRVSLGGRQRRRHRQRRPLSRRKPNRSRLRRRRPLSQRAARRRHRPGENLRLDPMRSIRTERIEHAEIERSDQGGHAALGRPLILIEDREHGRRQAPAALLAHRRA